MVTNQKISLYGVTISFSQACILPPLLFIIYIFDLLEIVESERASGCADDSKLSATNHAELEEAC